MADDTDEEWERKSSKRPRLRLQKMDLWSKQTTSCLLFRLPREVRDVIYSHFIPGTVNQSVKARGVDALKLDRSVKVLRAVDREGLAQREAVELYFRTKTFVFDSPGCIGSFQNTIERMQWRSVDVCNELRRVEVVGWDRMREIPHRDSPFQWARTRNFFRACIKLLVQCTGLSSVKIYLDADHFYLDDVRPLFGRVQGRILFEVCEGDKVDTKCLPGSRDALQRFLEAERELANGGVSHDWEHIGAVLDAAEPDGVEEEVASFSSSF